MSAKMRKNEREQYLDRIRGGLLGGAIGDAFGYPVEFLRYSEIVDQYGEQGIQEFDFQYDPNVAVITDDTQMTLFTANGILYGETKGAMRKAQAPIEKYIRDAYKDWYGTQNYSLKKAPKISWLLGISNLYALRAPGNACLSALSSNKVGSIDEPINNSKGCGGVMRVAPVGLYYGPCADEKERERMNIIAAEAAAITHGHPLGYVTAAILAHIVNVGVYGGCKFGNTLEDAVREAIAIAYKIFDCVGFLKSLEVLLDWAMELAQNDAPDIENILKLGEGWVAEETLAIALYCSCRYRNDFSKAMVASVNHNGDSDSTGAVTGNILGAWLGYEVIENKWKERLEMRELLLEMAEDLCYGCVMREGEDYVDEDWKRKYIDKPRVKVREQRRKP